MTRARWTMAVLVAVMVAAALAWTFLRTPAEPAPPPGPPATVLGWAPEISLLAGDGVGGMRDGAGAQARFADPYGLALDAQGVLYVADGGDNNRVRRVYPDGRVDTLAGQARAGAMVRRCRRSSTPLRRSRWTRPATCSWPTPATT